jgi:hypothetical protein
MDAIQRMERMIENERNPVRRWAMRRVLKDEIRKMELRK